MSTTSFSASIPTVFTISIFVSLFPTLAVFSISPSTVTTFTSNVKSVVPAINPVSPATAAGTLTFDHVIVSLSTFSPSVTNSVPAGILSVTVGIVTTASVSFSI